MTVSSKKLSAFLDGELPASEMLEIERALEDSPELQAELELLMQADGAFQAHFEVQLNDPVPIALAQAIEDFDAPLPANTPTRPKSALWLASLGAVAALFLGAAGGVLLSQGMSQPVVQAQAPARSWLDDIADYHAVYAQQKRHLVEVPAKEAAHIETWLTKTIGTPLEIPDLTAQGLTFEGGRLLVAAGKPVGQLIFTDAQGGVVALCLIQTDSPINGVITRQAGAFDMVSWGTNTANFVLVGDKNRKDLPQIAKVLAQDV